MTTTRRPIYIGRKIPGIPGLLAMLFWMVSLAGTAAAAGYSPANPAPISEASPSLQILDAQHFGPTVNGTLTLPGTASVGAPNAVACVTDGCSVLVVRLKPHYYFDAAVTFTLQVPKATGPENAQAMGSLWQTMPSLPAPTNPNSTKFGNTSITIQPGQAAVVYFRPPSRYILTTRTASGVGTTQSDGSLEFTASAGGKVVSTGSINIYPPPLALVHGILADPNSMSGMQSFLTAQQLVPKSFLVDWSGQNDSGFGVATQVFATDVLNQIAAYRGQNIAVTRVDVVGHSMGGCLAILYGENVGLLTLTRPAPFFKSGQWDGNKFPFYRASNFGQGDFRRVVTIDSPLEGAPIAQAISTSLTSGAINGGAFKLAITGDDKGGGGDYNCFYDLSPTSGAMAAIDTGAMLSGRWLPVVCTASPGENAHNLDPEVNQWLASALSDAVLGGIDVLSNAYDASIGVTPSNSDMVVLAASQGPALSGAPPVSATAGGLVHTQAESAVDVEQLVEQAIGGDNLFTGQGPNQGYLMFNAGFPG